jgi:hypothetical protein
LAAAPNRPEGAGENAARLTTSGVSGVIVRHRGTYANATSHEMTEGLERGHLSFRLHGEKLSGGYALIRIRDIARLPGSAQDPQSWQTACRAT